MTLLICTFVMLAGLALYIFATGKAQAVGLAMFTAGLTALLLAWPASLSVSVR